jgi:signal peptidase II
LIIFTSVFLVAGIIYFLKNFNRHPILTTSLILIISGGFGNLIDRVFRDGKVIDYIDARFIDFPVFNFADICVVIGAILLAVYIIFLDRPKKNDDGIDKVETEASNEEA